MQAITLLGATGSIGESTLDVIARHPDKYEVFALTGNLQIEKLAAQCLRHGAQFAVVPQVFISPEALIIPPTTPRAISSCFARSAA